MSVRTLSSRSNAAFRQLVRLSSGRVARREGRALVCGRRLVAETLERRPQRILSRIYPDGHPDLTAEEPGEPLALTPELFREVDSLGTGAPLLVVETDPIPDWDPSRETDGLTLILPLGDPENLGAALRSAAAFTVQRVVLTREAAHPFGARAIRAAAGSGFDLRLRAGPPLAVLAASPPPGLTILALDRAGPPLHETQIDPGLSLALLVGEEGRGLPDEPVLRRVSLPIAAEVDSLNAAVAVGIALYEIRVRSGLGSGPVMC